MCFFLNQKQFVLRFHTNNWLQGQCIFFFKEIYFFTREWIVERRANTDIHTVPF